MVGKKTKTTPAKSKSAPKKASHSKAVSAKPKKAIIAKSVHEPKVKLAAKTKAKPVKAVEEPKVRVSSSKSTLSSKLRHVAMRPANKKTPTTWQGWIESIRGLWSLGAIAGVGLTGYALWSSQQPMEYPAPVQMPPTASAPAAPVAEQAAAPVAVPAPVQAAPVAQTAPAGDSARAPAQAATPPAEPPKKAIGPLSSEFGENNSKSVSDRVEFWSAYLAKLESQSAEPGLQFAKQLGGTPFVDDDAPLLPAKFDCTTFVETVAALSRSHSADEFFSNLIAIRYHDGKPGFMSRNHFPEADWVPNNERAGIIRDVTAEIARAAGFEPGTVKKTINRGQWLAEQKKHGKVSRSLASVDADWEKPVDAHVTYIPMDKLEKTLAALPSGSIVNLVRASSDAHPVLIGHQGILLRHGKYMMIRHSSVGGHIRTLEIRQYLRSIAEKGDAHDWALVGINVNEIKG